MGYGYHEIDDFVKKDAIISNLLEIHNRNVEIKKFYGLGQPARFCQWNGPYVNGTFREEGLRKYKKIACARNSWSIYNSRRYRGWV